MHYEFDSSDASRTPRFDTKAITLNEWNTVDISQMVKDGKSILLFKVNGFIYHNIVNGNPRTYPALDFYSAFGTWRASSGQIRDFQFYSSDVASDIPALSGTYGLFWADLVKQ